MHHFSYVRKNIREKLELAAFSRHISESEKELLAKTYEGYSYPGIAYWGPCYPVRLRKLNRPHIKTPIYDQNLVANWSPENRFVYMNDLTLRK
jgi:hypothetical protein